jgi:outer membrane protein insertion porin family
MLAALLAWAGPAAAQARDGTVSEIRVEGAQRIEPETVRSYMSFRPGDRIDTATLDRSLKALYATGLFADVTIRREGRRVIVRVVENPIINRLAFEGNKRIEDDALEAEVQLRPRLVYTRSRVQADVQRIIEVYRRSGRFAATVEPKVVQLPQNRVDLIFEINEGETTKIRSINFVGNRRFSDRTLRGVVQTEESAWYRIFSVSDTYDPDRLTFDRELLRRFYLKNGYADFRVVSVNAELAPDRDAFFVTFTVEEGERYKFGKLDLSTALRNLDLDQLRALIAVKTGDWYDADQVEKIIGALTDAVGNVGYAFVDISPRVRRDTDKRMIDVTFNIQEGPRVFVERINITGNVRTIDKVVRREMLLVEGDAFNTSKIRRSRQRIGNLGFFDKVEVTNNPGSASDRTVIDVKVREQATGEISFGAGFSSSTGILGDISMRERNLLGRGQDLRLSLTIGQREQQIDLSFTEPYFLDRNLSAGFDLFRTASDRTEESSFNLDTTGFSLRIGYRLGESLSQRWKYTLRFDDITDIQNSASLAVKEQEGGTSRSLIAHRLTYDRRDNRFEPTTGYFVELANEFAGLGGTVTYLRNKITGAYYYPFTENLIGSIVGATGYVFGIGEDVRIIDRFNLGGSSLRGFALSGVGPRDIVTDDSIGGNWFYRASLQVTFPLGLPDEFGIKGRLFTDFGSLGGIDDKNLGDVTDTGSLRASVGVGIGWRSPFGPVTIDIGQAIIKEDFDDTEKLRFSFGTRF